MSIQSPYALDIAVHEIRVYAGHRESTTFGVFLVDDPLDQFVCVFQLLKTLDDIDHYEP